MTSFDFIFILQWWALIFVIGISFLPLTFRIFPGFLDKGYIFSKIIGILLISYLIFILSSLHVLQFNFFNILVCWGLLLTINILLYKKGKLNIRPFLKIFLLEELIFLATLIAWSIIRGYSPEIHGLEKYMDFGFVNSILRSTYFPPKDMWLTPFSINYYYFGHLFTAVLTKLSQIPPQITFNLMVAAIFAFTFSMSFSIGVNLIAFFRKTTTKKNIILGFFFGLFVALAGNLQTIYAFFKSYTGSETAPAFWTLEFLPQLFPNGYWYPNATRFIHRTIHEFPSYSFVVADLHGHVLDIPVVLCGIAVLLSIFVNKKITAPLILFLSFLLSISYMTNAWDGLIYLGLGIFIILSVVLLRENKRLKNLKNIVFGSFKYIFILFAGFFIFSFVFNQNFSPFASGIGLNCSPDFLVSIGKIGPFIFEKGQCQISPFWQILILYGFFFFTLISFCIFIRNKKILLSDYFVLLISFFSLLLIITPEIFYLKDIYDGYFRANTMFKLSYQAFIMFSFSSVYILIRISSSFKTEILKSKLSSLGYLLFMLPSMVLIFFVMIYPFFAIPSGYGDLKKYQSLDGLKYLNETRPEDLKAINFLNKNIPGQPVILEAQGDSYTDFERISANTGLPTVLGWTVHEWLWRGSYDVPAKRFDDIKNLYESTNINLTRELIKKYNISLIYVGEMEREKYKVNEAKFLSIGNIIYSSAEVKIYKVD